VEGFFTESGKLRGIYFGYVNHPDKIDKFMKSGVRLLSPDFERGDLSMFFLEDEGSVLFKFNRTFSDRAEALKEVYKRIINKFTSISEEDFTEETEWWIDSYNENISLRVNGLKLSISTAHLFPLFVCIKTKDFDEFKEKIMDDMDVREES
jgi:hypothetical protein